MMLNGALFLLACAAARAAASAGDGPLLNGNFEYAPNRSQMNGTRVTGPNAIPYWKVTGFVEYIESGARQGGMVLTVPEGRHAVQLGAGSSIRQQLSVTRGKYYSITFSVARTCAQSERLKVSVVPGDDDVADELPIQTVYTSSGWDSYSWAFKAKQGVVSFIIHHGDDHEEDPACGPIVDCVAMRALNPPRATHNNMLVNGDFEEGPYITPGSPWGVLVPPMDEDDTSPLPGWMVMSYSKVVKYIDSAHFRVPHGARAVELVAGVEVALVQEVAGTVPGRSYRLSFSVGDARNGCVGSLGVDVYAAREKRRVTYHSRGTGGHKCAKLEFTAIADKTRVVFQSSNHHTVNATLCGPVVDDVWLVRLK